VARHYAQKYVWARSARRRPLCQHVRDPRHARLTLCGRELSGWSLAFSETPVELMLCIACKRRDER